jgi:TolB-like protein/tetratricopeptide (TPR) repeat protein
MSLIAELKRRNVFRVGVAYAIVAWLLIEVASVIFPGLHLPDWTLTFLIIVILAGFPLALIIAWAFELTPEGIKRESAVSPDESTTRTKGRKLDFAIIGLLAIAVVYFAIDKFVLEQAEVTAESVPATESLEREKSIRSLAVLPLENLSGDPEQEYFADAMTDVLIGELANIGALSVTSRTSVMQYKGTRRPLTEIARELGVQAILEGTIFRDTGRVRVTVQLIDGQNDRHIWSSRFERDLRDVFAMQGEVARSVADKIRQQVTAEEEERLSRPRPVASDALEAYAKGVYHLNTPTASGAMRAIDYFEQAIQQAPDFAQAYARLAQAYLLAGPRLEGLPNHEAIPKMRAATLSALALDDLLGSAHTALGFVFLLEWEWERAREALQRGSELTPSDPWNLQGRSLLLSMAGHHEEAIALMRRAIALDPGDLNWRGYLVTRLVVARRYPEALEEARALQEMKPDSGPIDAAWTIYTASGQKEEAARSFLASVRASGTPWEVDAVERGYLNAGLDGVQPAWLEAAVERTDAGEISAPYVAAVYAGSNETEAAFMWLERAYARRDPMMFNLGMSPSFDPLRSDPRYTDLLRRMNYPGSQSDHADP